MKKTSRLIASILAFLMVISVFFIPAAAYQPVLITNPDTHEIGNDLVTAYVDNGDGRFIIATKQGRPDLVKK